MNEDEMFDILVIGGGATGTGVALDAITRGSCNFFSICPIFLIFATCF